MNRMPEIRLFNLVINSTLLMAILAIISIIITYMNYRKKPSPIIKMNQYYSGATATSEGVTASEGGYAAGRDIIIKRLPEEKKHETDVKPETKIEFDVLKFPESIYKIQSPNEPVDSDWSIQIWRPTKSLKFCNVLLNGTKLPWWNQKEPTYELFIEANSGGNVRVPKKEFTEETLQNAKGEIRDGEKILEKFRFKNLPIRR